MSEAPLSTDQHTPGPWEYWPAMNYDGYAIAPRGILPTLASVERCGHNVNIQVHNFPGSTEANARLIAAAPDLLEALTQQVKRCSCPYGDCLTCEASKSAIDKAEGKKL